MNSSRLVGVRLRGPGHPPLLGVRDQADGRGGHDEPLLGSTCRRAASWAWRTSAPCSATRCSGWSWGTRSPTWASSSRS